MDDVILGVGDGSGNLFVHGDYESIKVCQNKLFELEKLRALNKDTIPIKKTTLRKLGIVLFNTYNWLRTDAKYTHPNSAIRDLQEATNEIRTILGIEIAGAEQNDFPREVSAGEKMATEGDDNRAVSSGDEDKEQRVEG